MTLLNQLENSRRAMSASRAMTRHREQEHRRDMRMRRHQAVGVVATIGFLLLLPLVDDLGTYVALVAAAGLALASFARAIDLRLGYTWGRLYRDPRRITWFDRWVLRLVTNPHRGDAGGEQPRVRVLPPAT